MCLRKGCVNYMHKVAVIGDRDSVLGFKAVGYHVEYSREPNEAARIIHRLAREEYAIIFITEQLAKEIPETLKRYNAALLPAIIPIPDNQGSTGFGLQALSENVEKAVGVNILLNEEGDA